MGLRISSFPDSKNWNSHTHVTPLHNLHDHFFCGFCPHGKPILTWCLSVRPTSLCSFQLKCQGPDEINKYIFHEVIQSTLWEVLSALNSQDQASRKLEKRVQNIKSAEEQTGEMSQCAFFVVTLFSPHPSLTAVWDRMRSCMVRPDLVLFYSSTRLQFKDNYFA